MTAPFAANADGGVVVRLGPEEAETLSLVGDLLASVDDDPRDPGRARLDVDAYPDDPDASFEFRRLMASELEQSRVADRSAFAESLDVVARQGEVNLSPGEAEAWLIAIGEARLVLAARLGIEEEGWGDEDEDPPSPSMALLHYLSWVQGSLAEALLERL